MKLTKFIVGETSFLSRGLSTLKISTAEEVNYIDLPIKSIGVVELQEELAKTSPTPPSKLTTIKKGSEEAKQLGLSEETTMRIFDTTDEDYLKEIDEYRRDFMWQIAIFALDMEFVDNEGTVITDFKKKKAALINANITEHHLDQIFEDVKRLTSDREIKADFLSGNTLG